MSLLLCMEAMKGLLQTITSRVPTSRLLTSNSIISFFFASYFKLLNSIFLLLTCNFQLTTTDINFLLSTSYFYLLNSNILLPHYNLLRPTSYFRLPNYFFLLNVTSCDPASFFIASYVLDISCFVNFTD